MCFSSSHMLHRTLSNDLGASLSCRAWVCPRVSRSGQRSLLLSHPRASGQTETSSLAPQTLVTTSASPVTHTLLRHGHFPWSLTGPCLPRTVLLDQRLRPQARPEVLPLTTWPQGPRVAFPGETRAQATGSQRPKMDRAIGCAVGSSPRGPGWVDLSAPGTWV